MKTLSWLVLAMVVGILIFGGYQAHRTERLYQENTSAEVKAKHLAIEEELKTVEVGDFVEMVNGDLYVVIRPPRGAAEALRLMQIQGFKTTHVIKRSGRRVARVIKKDNPDWPETSKRFLTE